MAYISEPQRSNGAVTEAERFGARAIAVVLTGGDSDGAAGARAIKAAGGVVLAQDATSAEDAGMPSAALRTGSVDRVLPLADIAAALLALVTR